VLNIKQAKISFVQKRQRFQQARAYRNIHSRFQEFTMVPEVTYLSNLELAERVRDVPGCVAECGVWRGGMIAGIASVLGPSRNYLLFDSFQGLPPAQAVDGESAIEWQKNTTSPEYHNNCAARAHYAETAMELAEINSYEIVSGWFHETLPRFSWQEPVALLRLDSDWYESTIACLECIFQQVTPGGLVLVDDYYTWNGCSHAVHTFLAQRAATERIREFNGVCYMIKG
jgi:O-methyltransferase